MFSIGVLYYEFAIFVTVMFCGFFGTKRGWFTKETQQAIGKIMLYICIPAVVLKVMLEAGGSTFLLQWRLFLSIFCVTMGLMFLGKLVGKLCRLSGRKLTAYQALFMFHNTGYMGFPLVQAIFGTGKMLPIVVHSISDNLLVWTMGNYLVSGGKHGGKFAWRRICNPIVISIVFSLLLSFTGINPDGVFLFDAIFGLAGMTRYFCMLWLGMELTKLSFRQTFQMPCLYAYVGIKMIALPLIMHPILAGLSFVDETAVLILTLQFSLPAMATIGVLAQNTQEQEFVTSMILGTMLLSLVTIPLVFLLQARLFGV